MEQGVIGHQLNWPQRWYNVEPSLKNLSQL